MKQISLDELALHSPWPGRLLGLDEFVQHKRTVQSVYREYELEKYRPIWEAVKEDPQMPFDEVKRLAVLPRSNTIMSVDEDLYETTMRQALYLSERTHLQYLVPEARVAKSVVDLGCGYGRLLRALRGYTRDRVELIGGDVSPSAVDIARHYGLRAYDFNFTAPENGLMPLAAAEPPVVVVTAYTMHQLPSSERALKVLERYREKIQAVVCLEPEEELFGDGVLGLLRRAYGKANDYSADLLKVLGERDDVEIKMMAPNAVGANALLPGTISVWRFR